MALIQKVPKPLKFLIRLVTDEQDWVHLEGDYDEIYQAFLKQKKHLIAILWILKQLFTATLLHFFKITRWSFIMFKNYLKLTFRIINKQKGYSFINIFGLAAGMACSLLILLWVRDELSFDRYHTEKDSLYRVILKETESSGTDKSYAVSPIPLAPAAKEYIPEIIRAARVTSQRLNIMAAEEPVSTYGLLVSPDFFKMFTYSLIDGSREGILSSPDKIVITESMALRFFGTQNPVGQTLHTTHLGDFVVSGVIEDPPRQSHLRFEFLINFEWIGRHGRNLNEWMDISFFTYIQLSPHADIQDIERKLTQLAQTNLENIKPLFTLQALDQIYFSPPFLFDNIPHGSSQSVFLFSLIALAVLVIACINFINLSTARSGRRSLEVGLRKVVGARRSGLIRQFFGESLFITGIAGILAVALVILLLPVFATLTGKDFSLSDMISRSFLPFIFGVPIVTGLISGTYPAIFLSSFRPIQILKGKTGTNLKGAPLRKALIVFQFSLTIAVLVGVQVTGKQMGYLMKKDLGYDRDNMLVVRMSRAQSQQYETLKERIKQNPSVESVTATAHMPTTLNSGMVIENWEGKSGDEQIHIKVLYADSDYLSTFKIDLTEGHFFNPQQTKDPYPVILNEAAVQAMNISEPVGKKIDFSSRNGRILGIVRDFHFRSLRYAIEPAVILFEPETFYHMVIRLKPFIRNPQAVILYVRRLWKELDPKQPFSYGFFDEELNRLYVNEQVTGRLFTYFSALAVLIACLGLVGLASYTSEQRTKEIGIRKVLGASGSEIFLLLLREFTKWVVLANVIAWPLAYVAMKGWLKNFAYHIPLSAWIFPSAGLIALTIAILTVSWQSLRSSMVNPVKSLRQE